MDSWSAYFFQAEDKSVTDPREQAFHDLVREYVIVALILLILYGLSYVLICAYRRKRQDIIQNSASDDEDALVYRIAMWMCTFSLAISIGSASLLPFSVVTNEILIHYPDNYYTKWLNEDLVQRLWNNVFLFSNASLFVLLPFAYFFTESEGFSGSRKGIMSRVNETMVLLVILTILVVGMTYLICLILGHGQELRIRQLILVWQFLPFLYSCISFLGVLFLLLCTPVGIAKLFSVLGELVVKPRFLRNIQEEYDAAVFEEMHMERRLQNVLISLRNHNHPPSQTPASVPNHTDHQLQPLGSNDVSSLAPKWRAGESSCLGNKSLSGSASSLRSKSLDSLDQAFLEVSAFTTSTPAKPSLFRRQVFSPLFSSSFSSSATLKKEHQSPDNQKPERSPEVLSLQQELKEMRKKRSSLESQKRASAFRRNFGYPMAMLILLCLTVTSSLLVVQNTLELLVGIKALPVSSAEKFSLGISSLSKLGFIGSALEVTHILYLWSASIVGLYSLPVICRLRPRVGDTSFTCIIGNCVLLLVLSSALPVLSRIVGITNFDLLGDFGRIEWLGSFNIVLVYNIFFAGSTAFSLVNKFTEPVRRELFRRFRGLFAEGIFSSQRQHSISNASEVATPQTKNSIPDLSPAKSL